MEEIKDITTLELLGKEVDEILTLAENSAAEKAFVLALHGDLGAGKTTFTQTLAKKLGITETVTSPTFVVMKSYEVPKDNIKSLVHIDAYRIEDLDEMRVLRIDDIFQEKGTIVCIEWAEKISELLPPDTLHLDFHLKDEKRQLSIKQNAD